MIWIDPVSFLSIIFFDKSLEEFLTCNKPSCSLLNPFMVTFRCRLTYRQWFCAAAIVNSLSKLTSIAPGVCINKLSITDCQAALRVEEVKCKRLRSRNCFFNKPCPNRLHAGDPLESAMLQQELIDLPLNRCRLK